MVSLKNKTNFLKNNHMNKFFSILALSTALLGMTAACSDSDDNNVYDTISAKDEAISRASTAYINNTVLPTYKSMADAAVTLHDCCLNIQSKHAAGTLSSADVKAAADAWKLSRKSWELSEAFLFGPAADYNIDPHIDSWPLDKNAMDDLLADIRAGKEYTVDNNLGYGLLGFHSVEYMLFELSADGQTSNLHSLSYTPEELKYLTLVTEDLRNQCVLLEACWGGTENISNEKQLILEEAELDKGMNYGSMMINAGKPGSTYKTYQEVAEDILQGCIDIADEVGNTKIGRPNSGTNEDDKNYIESPYSLNSIEDFQDNIISIRNAYCGSVDGDASLSAYIKSRDPQLDADLRQAIDNAISAIAAIPEPFKLHATGPEATNARKVVGTHLVDQLTRAYNEILK